MLTLTKIAGSMQLANPNIKVVTTGKVISPWSALKFTIHSASLVCEAREFLPLIAILAFS